MVVDISVLITEGIMIRGRLSLKEKCLNVIYFSPGPYFKWVIKISIIIDIDRYETLISWYSFQPYRPALVYHEKCYTNKCELNCKQLNEFIDLF